MVGSRVTHSTAAYEAAIAAVGATNALVNQQNMILPPPGGINHSINIPPPLDIIFPHPRMGIVQAIRLRALAPLLIERPKISHSFGILKANLGANELINGICNIVQQQNYKAMEERFLRLEENLHYTQPWENLGCFYERLFYSIVTIYRKKEAKFIR